MTSTSTQSNRAGGVRALAWTCLGLCLLLVAFAATVAAVTSTRRVAALDPLPALRWDDVR